MKQERIISIGENIHAIVKILHSIGRKALRDEELTHPQYCVLNIIAECSPCKMKKLKENLGVSAPDITAVAEQLVKKGLITRERSKKDRRVIHAYITQEGKTVLVKVYSKRNEIVASLFSKIDDTKQTLVEKAIAALLPKLEELKNEYII